jgi:hypothetical protein
MFNIKCVPKSLCCKGQLIRIYYKMKAGKYKRRVRIFYHNELIFEAKDATKSDKTK